MAKKTKNTVRAKQVAKGFEGAEGEAFSAITDVA